MSDMSRIFVDMPVYTGSAITKRTINPRELETWCVAMELAIRTNAEQIGNALTLMNKMSDIIEQLGDSVKVLADRIVELQTVCNYLDERVQKLESMKGDNNNA